MRFFGTESFSLKYSDAYACDSSGHTPCQVIFSTCAPVYVFIYTHYMNIKIGNKMDEGSLEDSKEMCIAVSERAKILENTPWP